MTENQDLIIVPDEAVSLVWNMPQEQTGARGVSVDAIINAWLEARAHSPRTEQRYRAVISHFRDLVQRAGLPLIPPLSAQEHIQQQRAFCDAIADIAQKFATMRSPQSRRNAPVTVATQANTLSALSSFYDYAIKRGHLLTANPVDAVDRRRVEAYAAAQGMEEDDIAERIAGIDETTDEGAQSLALLLLLVSTGRRVAEVANLRKRDITVSGKTLRLRFDAKGGKVMRDTLSADVSAALVRWLQRFYRNAFWTQADDAPLFVQLYHSSRRGAPLGYHAISGICERYIGTSKVHTTRHTFALLMRKAGADVKEISDLLGHSNIATTDRYLRSLAGVENTRTDKLSGMLFSRRRTNKK